LEKIKTGKQNSGNKSTANFITVISVFDSKKTVFFLKRCKKMTICLPLAFMGRFALFNLSYGRSLVASLRSIACGVQMSLRSVYVAFGHLLVES